jgi:adenosylhomocysteine nucleosidase
MNFKIKQIGKHKLLYVMALNNEYGAHLKKRFKPLFTGVGPIEAAISLSKTLSTLKTLPDIIISLGSAGSATLEQTEIYQASSISYRDMDASPLGFEKGATPFLDLPAIIKMPHILPNIPSASLSTGANIISGKAYEEINANMVDMESFAILRVCQIFNLPMVALRGISDGKDELNHIDDWVQYLHIIDKKMAQVIDRLEIDLNLLHIE